MPLSATTPLEPALQRTRKLLFEPFDAARWLALGFCVFLARLGLQGGQSGFQFRTGPLQGSFDWVQQSWVGQHGVMALGVGFLLALLVLGIAVVVIWLQARGRFMFLDGVVRHRGAVSEPWSTWREAADSAFRFKLCLMAVAVPFILLLGGMALLLPADSSLRGALVLVSVLLIPLFVALGLVDLFLNDFVVPAMYARGLRAVDAFRVVWNEVLVPHAGPVALFVLVRIGIALVSAALILGLVCATFCLAACLLAIPYVGTVLLLPLYVFPRCYALYSLEPLGPEWTRLEPPPTPPAGPPSSDTAEVTPAPWASDDA
jgi:hypothetical protein